MMRCVRCFGLAEPNELVCTKCFDKQSNESAVQSLYDYFLSQQPEDLSPEDRANIDGWLKKNGFRPQEVER